MVEIEKTDPATSSEPINCPIGKWYFKRMTMLSILLLGFAGWFIYDGKVKYPVKSFEAVAKESFEQGAGKTWEEYEKTEETNLSNSQLTDDQMVIIKEAHAAGASKAPWRDYAVKTKIDQAEPAAGAENHDLFKSFSAGAVEEATWKEYAEANGLSVDPVQDNAGERAIKVMKAFDEGGKPREWTLYAEEKDWPEKTHFYSASDISQQIYFGSACGIGGIAVLIVMLLNRKRAVSADGEAYFPKPNKRVPYEKVFKIDTRKWRRKGLAYAYYKDESGEEKKAVLDDLKYVGSQEILDRMVGSFEGELIEELVEEDDEEEGEDSAKEIPKDKEAKEAESDGDDTGSPSK